MDDEIPDILKGQVGWVLQADGRTPMKVGVMDFFVLSKGNRPIVARDEVDGVTVSTVFYPRLVPDTGDDVPPPLFESMVFGASDAEQHEGDTYLTWEEAEQGHRRLVDLLKERNEAKYRGGLN